MSRVLLCPTSSTWQQYWPTYFLTYIAVFQLILSSVILGLQTGVIFLNIDSSCNNITPRYIMGFATLLFCIIIWIATFCTTCCIRSSISCATYVLVENILILIFLAMLINFDRRYLVNPYIEYNDTKCLWSHVVVNNALNLYVALNKAQLVLIILMMVSSLGSIGIYTCTYIITLRETKREHIENGVPAVFLNQHVPLTSCLQQQIALTPLVPNRSTQQNTNYQSNSIAYHFPQIMVP